MIIAAFIEAKLQEDDELTTVEIQRLLSRKFSMSISAPTIRRYIRMHLKWVVARTRFGPMISDKNKAKRSVFTQMCLDTNDTFNNVIWINESSVPLTRQSDHEGEDRERASTEVCCKTYCQSTCVGRNL